MSQWFTDCFHGKLAKLKKHVAKNQRILDRRETPLRINGLMYACVGYKFLPTAQKVECIKFLLKKGTPVDARDFIGETALHQIFKIWEGDLDMREIADLLLRSGADINAKNREGKTPFFTAVCDPKMNKNIFMWCLENGADPGAVDRDGIVAFDKAMIHLQYEDAMTQHMARLCKAKREEAVAAGRLRSCAHCKAKTSKKCSGCYMVYWCGKDCLKAGWDGHKQECRQIKGEYETFALKPSRYRLDELAYGEHDSDGNIVPWIYKKPPGSKHFSVKIQAPFKVLLEHDNEAIKDKDMIVYNEKKSIFGFITREMDFYGDVLDAIRTQGVLGVRAFFYAFWEDGTGLKINFKRVQPPDIW